MNQKRTPLATMRGKITTWGDKETSKLFAKAWRKAVDLSPLEGLHGMHSYPARMHPEIAKIAIGNFSEKGDKILDPFMGSGTSLVEANAAGRFSAGIDLNPLAFRLSKIKTKPYEQEEFKRLNRILKVLAERSEDRVRSRINVRAKISPQSISSYEVHILKELAGLLEEIKLIERDSDKLFFEMLFSAICVKFSKQRSDTKDEEQKRRLRKGLVTEFFLRRGQEWLSRIKNEKYLFHEKYKSSHLVLGDARNSHQKISSKAPYSLVITSPPYGGTYNYSSHHKLRFDWLGLKSKDFATKEIGSRNKNKDKHAKENLEKDLLHVLAQAKKNLHQKGSIVLVLGDTYINRERVDSIELINSLSEKLELNLIGGASQSRRMHHNRFERSEHIMLIKP